jgi:hypothetical protein
MQADTAPNLYELNGDNLQVTYSTTSIAGQPIFTFQQGRKTLSFKKSEIKITKTPIGTLVSVLIEAIPDLKTVTFALVLPDVNLQQSTKVNIKTVGILTTSKTSIGGPNLVKGAVQAYKAVALSGTAKAVEF